MNSIILTWVIDLPLHEFIYVICSSWFMCYTGVSTPQARARLHVCVHIAPYAHFGSIVGVNHGLDFYRQLGLICDVHSAILHVIVVLVRKSFLYTQSCSCQNTFAWTRVSAYVDEHSIWYLFMRVIVVAGCYGLFTKYCEVFRDITIYDKYYLPLHSMLCLKTILVLRWGILRFQKIKGFTKIYF